MNTDRSKTLRMVMLAMMVAIGVVISPILRIEAPFAPQDTTFQKYDRPYTRSIMNRIFLDIKHSALCIQIVHAFPFLFCYPYILCLSLLLPAKNVWIRSPVLYDG